MLDILKDPKDKAIVKKVCSRMNQKSVERLFYGDAIEASGILIPLRKMLYGGKATEKQYVDMAAFYNTVWVKKHMGISFKQRSATFIKESLKLHISGFSDVLVEKAADMCLEYIYEHEPTVDNIIGEYTESSPAFLSGLPYRYVINYEQAGRKFNQEKYSEAISFYKKCLEVKEDDTNARFEMAEAYMCMGGLGQAEEVLLANVPFISKETDKARFYRRIAVVKTEKEEYATASAALLYSWLIENNPKAIQGLEYIKDITGCEAAFSCFEVVMLLESKGLLFWKLHNNPSSVSEYYIRTIVPGKTSYKSEDMTEREVARLQKIIEIQSQKTPSELFASGAVFDIARSDRELFEEAIHSENAFELMTLLIRIYDIFLEHPEIAGVFPISVDKNKNDTNPTTWNTDIFNLSNGDYAIQLFMPIENDIYLARIVGIIFGSNGDGYYYCMLNKDREALSVVKRNMIMYGIRDVGEVKGAGISLMNDFYDCMIEDFYASGTLNKNKEKAVSDNLGGGARVVPKLRI